MIFEESKKISKCFNPICKKKSICEFIDLCRVSAPNINEEYNKVLSDNPNFFKKKNDMFTESFDLYGQYSSICDKPFKKFRQIEP